MDLSLSFSSIRSFFTPSVLFLLLNLVIATIALISSRHRRHLPRPLLHASSYNALERVRSLGGGLFRFRSGDLPPINANTITYELETTTSTVDEHDQEEQHHDQYRRVQSDLDPRSFVTAESTNEFDVNGSSGRSRMQMKKSVSAMMTTTTTKSSVVDADQVVSKRPSRIRREASVDEEVNTKADDFINRFREQLKLQRLDSFLRYKDMINKN